MKEPKPLRHSLTLVFISLSVLPILIMSFFVLYFLSQSAIEQISEKNQLLAKSVSNQAEVFLLEPLVALKSIRSSIIDTDMKSEEIQSLLDNHVGHIDLFESIMILDREGTVISVGLPKPRRKDYRHEFLGINLAHKRFIQDAIKSGEPTWSDTFFSLTSGKMSLAVCLVVDERVLVGNFYIDFLKKLIKEINLGDSVVTVIVDRQGAIIVHPSEKIAGRQVKINHLPLVAKGLDGEAGTDSYEYQGVKYIGSVALIDGPGWLTLVSQTTDDAYQPVWGAAWILGGGFFVALILALLFGLVKARRLSRPLSELAVQAKVIASGEYEFKFVEPGYLEINELAASLAKMSQAVQGREKQLLESQLRFKDMADTVPCAIYRCSLDSTWTVDFFSNNIEEITGYPASDFINNKRRSFASVIHSEDVAYVERAVRDAVSEDRSWALDYRVIHADGTIHWVYEEGRAVADDDSGERWLDGIILDNTERRLAEDERIRLKSQLQQAQKMEAIGTLAGGIAHDFNNILTPILGYTQMSLDCLGEKDPCNGYMNEVFRAALRAADLVQQILSFSRQGENELIPVQVPIIAKEALKLMRASLPATIKIIERIDSLNEVVMADPTKIHQIVVNLCTNAYHAMRPKGGTLEVVVNKVEINDADSHVNHLRVEPGEYLKLSVCDSGHGMSQDIIDRIFEPYFTTKSKGEGTGMGLAVVHGIVKSYGGHINVESTLYKGASFFVYLPVVLLGASKVKAVEDTSFLVGNEKIMVIDDEEPIALMEKEILEGFGYHVTAVSVCEEALQMFCLRPDSFDLVITDMTMPQMTGAELARRFLEVRADIPIILCTGYSELIDEEKAKAIGIKEFLLKPVTVKKLAKAVREVLG